MNYKEELGNVHFNVMFIGVFALNILFDTGTSTKTYYSNNASDCPKGEIKPKGKILLTINKGNNKSYFSTKSVDVKNNIYKASQRFNTKDFQWLVGFTDGDGCFTTYKEKKYENNWRHEYTIGLHIKDTRLLYKIKRLLGCGIVRKYNNVVIYNIKKIEHILTIIIPLFDSNPLLTQNKISRYLRFRETFLNKVINSKRSTEDQKILGRLLMEKDMKGVYNNETINLLLTDRSWLDYFSNWIVGFTEAEGSFYHTKLPESDLRREEKYRPEFRVSQDDEKELLSKIKDRIGLNRDVGISSNRKNHYYIIAVSKKSLKKVIEYFNNPSIVKLKGDKLLQFRLWEKRVKQSE